MSIRETTFAQLIASGLLVIGDGYRAKNDELGGDGPIFLRAGHVTDHGFDFEGVERFTADRTSAVQNKMSRAGDVVVTTKGNSTGRVAYVAAELPPFVYSPHLSYWRSLDADRLAPGFLRYWSRSRAFHDQLGGLKASTDMAPYLSLVDQRRLRISLPDPQTQRAIAEVLGALDDRIELNRRTSETLETMARATFQHAMLDAAESSWPLQSLDEMIEVNPRRALRTGSEATYLDMGDMPTRSSRPARWTKRAAGSGARFANGDTLVARITPCLENGKTAFVDFLSDGEIAWGSTEYLVLCSRPPLPPHYPYLLARTEPFREFLIANMTGSSGRQRVPADTLRRYEVPLPPVSVLDAFAAAVEPLFEQTKVRDTETASLVDLRDALLPQLLSGGLRVGDAEHALVGTGE